MITHDRKDNLFTINIHAFASRSIVGILAQNKARNEKISYELSKQYIFYAKKDMHDSDSESTRMCMNFLINP